MLSHSAGTPPSQKRPFVRDTRVPTAKRVSALAFLSQNTLLKPCLSSATVALSSERFPDHPRECSDAHVYWLCPRLDPGAGPRLTARCAPGGGLRADLYRESQWRAARPAATACGARLYAAR